MAQPISVTGVSGDGTSSGGGLDFSSLLPQILEKFLQVLEGAAIIAVGFFLIQYLRGKLRKLETTHEAQRNAINLLEKITSGFIIVISITLALKIIGIDMTLLVSVAILGLSYGLQDIIKNYVAGILILFKAPFRIGDAVKIRTFTGKVHKIDFQSTTLETFDRRYITIYNSDVMTQSIVNYSNVSSSPVRRISIDVMIGYASDVRNALAIFEKILMSNQVVLRSPKHSIVFKKFSESAITFTIKFWVMQPCNILKIRSEVATQISQAFDEQKIFMPYSKDIQGAEENDLLKVTEDHKRRIQEFYNSPLFAQVMATQPVQSATAGSPENPATGAVQNPDTGVAPGTKAGAVPVAEGIPGPEAGAVQNPEIQVQQVPPEESIDEEEPADEEM